MLTRAIQNQQGRTLIETLVATAMWTLLTLVISSMLFSALRWHRADRVVLERQRAVRNAADWMARDIRQAGVVSFDGALWITRKGLTHHYRITEDRLEVVDHTGHVALVLRPVTGMHAEVEHWTNVVRLTLESVTPNGSTYSVTQQITPRVVVP